MSTLFATQYQKYFAKEFINQLVTGILNSNVINILNSIEKQQTC